MGQSPSLCSKIYSLIMSFKFFWNNPKYFGRLRESAVTGVLANVNLRACFEALLGENPKVVQSMYFEGNWMDPSADMVSQLVMM